MLYWLLYVHLPKGHIITCRLNLKLSKLTVYEGLLTSFEARVQNNSVFMQHLFLPHCDVCSVATSPNFTTVTLYPQLMCNIDII